MITYMDHYSSNSTSSATTWGDYGKESFFYNCENNSTSTSGDEWGWYGIDNYASYKETVINATNYISKVMWRNEYPTNSWVSCSTRPIKTPQERLREMIQSRQAPAIHVSRKALNPVANIEEMRARDMLRRVIGHDKFRDFMRNGFVSVQAKSGKMYQIFPGHDITNVFLNGEKIERLCVVLRGQFPPTDSLIMRYLLILNDEQDFRSYAVQHKVYPSAVARVTLPAEPLKSLPELFRGLKVA